MQNSSNQDSHLRQPTVPNVTHYGQERMFPWQTSATCLECAPIRLVLYIPSHVTLLGLLQIPHESEKHSKKHWFGVICVSLQKGPRTKIGSSVIKLWAKSRIINKSRSIDDKRPERALLCLEQCSVAFSLSHAALYLSMNTHQESKTQKHVFCVN